MPVSSTQRNSFPASQSNPTLHPHLKTSFWSGYSCQNANTPSQSGKTSSWPPVCDDPHTPPCLANDRHRGFPPSPTGLAVKLQFSTRVVQGRVIDVMRRNLEDGTSYWLLEGIALFKAPRYQLAFILLDELEIFQLHDLQITAFLSKCIIVTVYGVWIIWINGFIDRSPWDAHMLCCFYYVKTFVSDYAGIPLKTAVTDATKYDSWKRIVT